MNIKEIINTIQDAFLVGVTKVKIYNDARDLIILKESNSFCGMKFEYRIFCDVEGSLVSSELNDFESRIEDLQKLGTLNFEIL